MLWRTATAAMASLRGVPSASAALPFAARGGALGGGGGGGAGGGGGPAGPGGPGPGPGGGWPQPTTRPGGPRRTSSYVLVSSRHTAAGRLGPNAAAASARDAGRRCGASKNTRVRGSVASAAKGERRSAGLRGRKPSKQNLSLGRPDHANAVVTAD